MIKLIICLATFLSSQILAQNSCLVCEYYNVTKTAQSSTRTNHHSQRATENKFIWPKRVRRGASSSSNYCKTMSCLSSEGAQTALTSGCTQKCEFDDDICYSLITKKKSNNAIDFYTRGCISKSYAQKFYQYNDQNGNSNNNQFYPVQHIGDNENLISEINFCSQNNCNTVGMSSSGILRYGCVVIFGLFVTIQI